MAGDDEKSSEEKKEEEEKKEKESRSSRWSTLAKVLGAIAGVLGAIASLIGALTATGVLNFDGSSSNGTPSPTVTTPAEDGLTGTRIAFLSDKAGVCDVYIANIDGSDEERVTRNDAQELRPDWSPDGKKLAFASNLDGDFDIYIVDLTTGQQRVVHNTDADEKGPTWSPDGEHIAFASTLDGNSEIWTIDSDEGAQPEQLTDLDAKSVSPDWSSDDDAIAFASNTEGDFDVHVMDIDGTNLQNVTGDALGDTGQEFDPSWSEDGEMISFEARRGSERFDIYVIDPDGSDLRNLTAHSADDRRSSWSPDDSKIVFGTDRLVPPEDTQRGCSVDTRQMDLFTMNTDGSNPERLLAIEADDSSPAWGPLP